MKRQPPPVFRHVHPLAKFPLRHAKVTGQQQRESVQRPVSQFFPMS